MGPLNDHPKYKEECLLQEERHKPSEEYKRAKDELKRLREINAKHSNQLKERDLVNNQYENEYKNKKYIRRDGNSHNEVRRKPEVNEEYYRKLRKEIYPERQYHDRYYDIKKEPNNRYEKIYNHYGKENDNIISNNEQKYCYDECNKNDKYEKVYQFQKKDRMDKESSGIKYELLKKSVHSKDRLGYEQVILSISIAYSWKME